MDGNNKSPIPESTSRRITSLRFLLIVMVVFIHNNFTQENIEEVAAGGTYILFNQNLVGKWVQLFISDGIACAAVPLFFLFAAYLQAKKADSYGTLLRKKAKSLLVPYIIWISLYVFYLAGLKLLVIKIAPGLIAKPEKNALSWTAADWLQQTLGYRATANGMLTFPGIAPHFWFIRDLIILTALSPVLQFLARRFPAAFLGLVSVAFFVPLNVYFVRDSQALFFYALGLLWGIHDIPLFEKIDQICIQGGGTTIPHDISAPSHAVQNERHNVPVHDNFRLRHNAKAVRIHSRERQDALGRILSRRILVFSFCDPFPDT